MTKAEKEALKAAELKQAEESLEATAGEESPVSIVAVSKRLPLGVSQAEIDLEILVQAQKIRLNPERLMAAKAIAGGKYIQ